MTMASRIDRRDILELPTLLRSRTVSKVTAARPMLLTLPKSGALGLPPIAQRAATGISVRPIVVMTMPVTSGGKNRVMREKIGVIARPTSDATITAPITAGNPPPSRLVTIATMVATPANETP